MVDVKQGDETIVVFVDPDTDDDDIAAVKVLAKIEWPECAVLVARRESIRRTGAHAITFPAPAAVDDESDEPTSPPPGRVRSG